jgi:hypothetical protein
MKRDMDLIRKILRKIRDHEDPYGLDGIPEIEGYSKKEISYNIGILKDGFAKKWGQISILDICQYIFWPERHQSTF